MFCAWFSLRDGARISLLLLCLKDNLLLGVVTDGLLRELESDEISV
jgi:hypothetical protein